MELLLIDHYKNIKWKKKNRNILIQFLAQFNTGYK